VNQYFLLAFITVYLKTVFNALFRLMLLDFPDFESWYKNHPGSPKVFNLPTLFFEQNILNFTFLRTPHKKVKLGHFVQKIPSNNQIISQYIGFCEGIRFLWHFFL